MGIAERKERDKMEMRERILEAATQMFLEDGYEKTSIRNIAEKIEYSPATIYLYFKDKDELFFSIHQAGFAILLEEMVDLKNIENPLDRLHELGKIYIEFALKNPEYYDLMFIMRAPVNAIKQKQGDDKCWEGESTYDFLLETVEECIEKNMIRSSDAMVTAMYTWSAVHGLVSLTIRERFEMLELQADDIRAMMFASLNELMALLKV